MPSHIDVLVGDYENGIRANENAIVADKKFLAREGPLNFYTLYRMHNYHFRIYCAMFAGQSRAALESAERLVEEAAPKTLLNTASPPMADWLESFIGMRVHALVRFGRWDDLINLPLPDESDRDLYCVTTALTYYGRGLAYAATGRVADAKREREDFREAVKRVPESRTLFNNTCADILAVASAMLDGELRYREGQSLGWGGEEGKKAEEEAKARAAAEQAASAKKALPTAVKSAPAKTAPPAPKGSAQDMERLGMGMKRLGFGAVPAAAAAASRCVRARHHSYALV